jgi:IS30 family transposase
MARVARWCGESGALNRSGVLRKRGARINHETIYRRIRWDKAGGDLWRHTHIMSKFRPNAAVARTPAVLPGKRPIGERR